MVTDNTFRIDSDNTTRMNELSGDLPANLLLWQVNFDEENDEFRISYRKVASHTLTNATLDGLKTYLRSVLDRQEPNWKPLKPDSDKSGKTPLSIHHFERTIMVFVLRHEKRWEFSKGRYPFQVQDEREMYYMMAKAVERSGDSVNLVDKPGPGCRIALFVADAKADRAANGTGSDKHFLTSFNIYADLLLKREDDADVFRRMPIAIDPDVGHPGGSEP